MYSNQNIISSKSKIKYATPKHTVRERLGNPIEYISKGRYRFEVKIMNMMFSIKITFIQQFYDKHEKNGVTALLQVSENMENRLRQQYGVPSRELEKALNYKIMI